MRGCEVRVRGDKFVGSHKDWAFSVLILREVKYVGDMYLIDLPPLLVIQRYDGTSESSSLMKNVRSGDIFPATY